MGARLTKPTPSGKSYGKSRSDATKAEPGLADTTGAGQGQQPDIRLTHESLKRRDLPLAANEACQGRRQMEMKPFPVRNEDGRHRWGATNVSRSRIGHGQSRRGIVQEVADHHAHLARIIHGGVDKRPSAPRGAVQGGSRLGVAGRGRAMPDATTDLEQAQAQGVQLHARDGIEASQRRSVSSNQ